MLSSPPRSLEFSSEWQGQSHYERRLPDDGLCVSCLASARLTSNSKGGQEVESLPTEGGRLGCNRSMCFCGVRTQLKLAWLIVGQG